MQDKPSGFQSRGWITRAMNGGNPVTYKGKEYRSHAALAREFGIPTARIERTLDRDGHLENLNTDPRRGPGLSIPCRIGDREFRSQRAMSIALGISETRIVRHKQKYGHFENLLTPLRDTSVTFKDRKYPSITALARATGFSRGRIRRHIKKYGNLKNLEASEVGNRRPIVLGGIRFPSRQNAADTMGINRSAMHRFAHGRSSPAETARIEAVILSYVSRLPEAEK